MCFAPKIPAPPPAAQFQAMQAPKDMLNPNDTKNRLRRRGFFASIMTGPSGITSPPSVTGSGGGSTGG